jgi:hypothetical protein
MNHKIFHNDDEDDHRHHENVLFRIILVENGSDSIGPHDEHLDGAIRWHQLSWWMLGVEANQEKVGILLAVVETKKKLGNQQQQGTTQHPLFVKNGQCLF